MSHKAPVTMAATLVALFLLSSPALAFAASSQSVSLGLAGTILDIGSQRYVATGSGASYVSLMGNQIGMSSGHFEYSIDGSVQGTTVSGHAQFQLTVSGAGAARVSIKAQVKLTGMIPAVAFPLTCDQTMMNGCTSAVPGFFTGTATMHIGSGDDDSSSKTFSSPILFESAYLNPFGAALYIGIPGYLTVITNSKTALSQWYGTKTGGGVLDTQGMPIGAFSMTSTAIENLVQGTEDDHGQIVLSGFSGQYSVLNSAGSFRGKSTIPPVGPGAVDCTALVTGPLGITLPAGVSICVMTGSYSGGSFNLASQNGHARIQGSYDTIWFTPAVGFTSVIQAAITK